MAIRQFQYNTLSHNKYFFYLIGNMYAIMLAFIVRRYVY